ncbi:MAG: NAD(P)/FAD-dependent oxidoreductase, partial [Gemmataceae bacterium]|nr:NAD(P)/FAD-dependent oxidoreductase [Gemmataceae bacterium]
MSANTRHQIVIVGGGTAGITVAARLRRADKNLDIAIIEPSEKHYYQPIWTLVGAGIFPKQVSERAEADYIPKGVHWLRDAVAEFQPNDKTVRTQNGQTVGYDYLVVAPGIQINWHAVTGLKEAIGRGGVCSNYDFRYVDYTWQCLREFQGGTAIFTQPNTPVKCGGAPQKIMYLADDYFRKQGVRDKAKLIFATAGAKVFGVPKFAPTLEEVFKRKGIEGRFRHNLVEIRGEAKEAVFENLETHERVTLKYDMIHVTPPQGPPDFIKNSPLANDAGWVDVDKFTLQHVRYPNVFGIG